MPKQEVFELHPTGWVSDPANEFFKLSTLDYCVAQVYNNFALFFKLTDAEKPKAVSILKHGLEVTLSQCRQLVGRLEEHSDGGLCFHKKKEDTVQFHVQWLDGPEDKKYPSFDELEKRHFVSQALGPIETWCVDPMIYGEKPEAEPASKPKASAFKASFIRGGLVFMMHHHHYANDIMGWAGEMHQLAENCAAIWRSSENSPASFAAWDPACLDLSRVTVADPPEEQRIDGPVSPLRHPDHKTGQWLLFHLPKSKTEELKKLASPGGDDWISSYDAYMALIWRVLSKHRARLFKPDLKQNLLWGEAVDMRRRFHDPPVPARIQGNVVWVAISTQSPVPQLTVEEVISEAPLSKLARYIRQLTNGINQDTIASALVAMAPIRDKTGLFLRIDSFPPMTNFTTEWRDAKPCEADFGFATPHAFRFPFDTVTAGLTVVLPVRKGGPAGDDEGNEFSIGFEKELAQGLIEDPEWNQFFEFRGVDAEEGGTKS